MYMTANDLEQINKIIIDLLMEFQNEQNRLQVMFDNGTSRLAELEEDIVSYKDTEDVDFKVFSPRNVSNLSEEKLMAMDREKTDIEYSNKELSKELKYYKERVDKLRTVLSILDETEIDNEEYIKDIDSKNRVDEEKESDAIDLELEKIRRLFNSNKNEDNSIQYKYKESAKIEDEDVSENIVDGSDGEKEDSDTVDNDTVSTNNIVSPGMKQLNDYESKSLIDDLDRISHRIEISYKVIDNDVFRTKMELKSIKSGIDDIIRGIKE